MQSITKFIRYETLIDNFVLVKYRKTKVLYFRFFFSIKFFKFYCSIKKYFRGVKFRIRSMNEKNNENLKVDFTRSKRFSYRKINCFILTVIFHILSHRFSIGLFQNRRIFYSLRITCENFSDRRYV